MGIEFALLGLDVTIIEKRGYFARNNSVHIWPSSIEDLKYVLHCFSLFSFLAFFYN